MDQGGQAAPHYLGLARPGRYKPSAPGPPLVSPCPQPADTYLLARTASVTFGSLEGGAGRGELPAWQHVWLDPGSQAETPSCLRLRKTFQATPPYSLPTPDLQGPGSEPGCDAFGWR